VPPSPGTAYDANRAGHSVRRRGDRRIGLAAPQLVIRQRRNTEIGGERLVERDDRGEVLVGHAREGRGGAGGVRRFRRDSEEGLPGIIHDVSGEDRVVVEDRAHVILARNVGGGEDAGDSGSSAHRVEIERDEARMRMLAHRDV
jgi:hypothetical protein